MKLRSRLLVLPAVLASVVFASAAHAQSSTPSSQGDAAACRQADSIVGIWKGNLDFSTFGKATVLVSINEGGTFTETDSIDLNGTVGVASPGYAAWKETSCNHYAVKISKTLYNPETKQFLQVTLPGTIVLNPSGRSWTVTLKLEGFAENGAKVVSGTVKGSAARVTAGGSSH
jgi:hypothetical protein